MVEEKCDVSGMGIDLESSDREALSRRTREILHQCYKFGFEVRTPWAIATYRGMGKVGVRLASSPNEKVDCDCEGLIK